MMPFAEARILRSWRRNAEPWAEAVRHGRIESRRLVTDRAIVDAVLGRAPGCVLDIGCGEGWLVRELAGRGIDVAGIDAVPQLIERARVSGAGEFHVVPYEAMASGDFAVTVDVLVSNFSLLGKESVEAVFGAVPAMLRPGGTFVIQTLHPVAACGARPYRDGWREGSWDGFGPGFTDPAPWYFRTLESWKRLFHASGMRLVEIREPMHPETQTPASILFIAEVGVAG